LVRDLSNAACRRWHGDQSGDLLDATMTIKGQDQDSKAGPFEMKQKIHGK